MMISVFDRVENVAKGEHAGYEHFLLFPQYLQKASSSGPLKNLIKSTILPSLKEFIGYQTITFIMISVVTIHQTCTMIYCNTLALYCNRYHDILLHELKG